MHFSHAVAFTTLAVLAGGVAWAVATEEDRRAATPPPKWAIARTFDDLRPAAHPAPPLSLTASDGSGLALESITGRAVVSDPLAFTELRLVFRNPADRVIEGTFSIALPPGATVSRFAMRLGEAWQEGEMVEKQAARRAYEDFLHRRQDPALLEQGAGSAFSARVFPIPARGTKELIVSWSQELSRPYALPLRGLPEIASLDLAVTLDGSTAPLKSLRQQRVTPQEDFSLDPSYLRPTQGLRSGNLVLARAQPVASAAPDPVGSAIVLVDTSASRALEQAEQIELVGRVASVVRDAGGPDAALTVAAFDQTTDPIFVGKAGAFGDAELTKLRERGALGASNLERALAWAAEHAKQGGQRRVIVISDGVPTAGETKPDALGAIAARLGASGVERLDALAVGGIRDEGLLRRVATAGLARDGAVLDGRLVTEAIARRLGGATRSNLAVAVEGARWWWPKRVDGAQAGDEVLVYADVPEGASARVSIGGVAGAPLDLRHVDRPLLERAWAQAQIASLQEEERLHGATADTKKQIVALSTRHRVMSPYTSLLVLETDQDYARFGIDRNALAPVLTVDHGRVAALERRAPKQVWGRDEEEKAEVRPDRWSAPPATATAAAPPRADTASTDARPAEAPPADLPRGGPPQQAASADDRERANEADPGSLGLSGVGEGGGGAGEGVGLGVIGTLGHGTGAGGGQGFGQGHGRIGGAHQTRSPSIRQGAVTVDGTLPPEVVQRIVRQSFGRARLCYEDGLRRNPSLAGNVVTRFTIDKDGSVRAVSDGGSTLPDSMVAMCIHRMFGALSFPAPERGTVSVVFPLQLSPEGGASATAVGPLEKPKGSDPYEGKLKDVMGALAAGKKQEALEIASAWRAAQPGDVLALVALGEAWEAAGDARAWRAYGSIIDLFGSRADMRRFAGERLERLHEPAALDLALDSYEKAAVERPDHPASHRLLAYAWLRKGAPDRAFDAMLAGVKQTYPSGRFLGVDRILREDLGLIAAAWIKAEPARKDEILAKLKGAGGAVESAPSLRFVLNWETDANDVDFHIFDDRGGHAYYASKALPSGGDLYADVTTGYGPECFTIRLPPTKRADLYTLQANYYSRGPMGYGMGKLEIIDHDGVGGLAIEDRPFVVMVDHAFVDLGVVRRGKQ